MVPVILTTETGAGLSGANSYVTLAYANAYFAGHPFYADTWADLTDDDDKANLLIYATRTVDNLINWRGYRATNTQALEWPRTYVVDDNGYTIATGTIPDKLKQAVCEMARYATIGDVTAPSAAATGLTKIKVDVIELDYSSTASSKPAPVMPGNVLALLRGLGGYVFERSYRRVVVG